MKKIIYTISASILALSPNIANAQSWQWGKRGGGSTSTISGTDEELKGLTTDKNGNSYVLATISTNKTSGDIDIDGKKLGKGYGDRDVCVVSFDCSGKYRWSKIIGGKSPDFGYDIKADTLGGIYITGNFYALTPGDSVFFDKDTLMGTAIAAPMGIRRSFFIIKYDTGGNYKWLRLPEPDTMKGYKYSGSTQIEVTPNGTISVFSFIGSSGAFANGAYVISTTSLGTLHMLKYDAGGNFIKGFPIQISGDGLIMQGLKMAWDYKSDIYYILGTNSFGSGLNFGTSTITGGTFLGKFSNTGSNIWLRQSSMNTSGSISSRPALDNSGNVYITSADYNGADYSGYKVTNAMAGLTSPFVVKYDASGIMKWGFSFNASIGANGEGIIISPSGEVGVSGAGQGTIQAGTTTISSLNTFTFFARLDGTTGALKFFDSLGSGGGVVAQGIATDKKGNFYVGGYFDAVVRVPTVGNLNLYGGGADFFLVKYGAADCKPTGINESLAEVNNIKIYPNPANDKITIEGLRNSSEVSLFSILGQQVVNLVTDQSGKTEIDISTLSNGMYLLQMKTEDGEKYKTKIIKQ